MAATEDVQTLAALLKEQLQASAEYEERMTKLLQQALQPKALNNSQPQPPPPKPTTVSADRPILLSTTTLADFTSWLEAWSDYSHCQHSDLQSKPTRVFALRQSLDKDIRRFLREGTIHTPLDLDADDIIQAVTVFIRR